jgi:Holliday junction resolvase RusA-like endonuclease
MIESVIYGKPITQGSMNRSAAGKTYHKNGATLTVWRQRIAAQFIADQTFAVRATFPLRVPLSLVAHFTVDRPASNKDMYPQSQRSGDVDKYLRAVGDALTAGGVIADDSLLVDVWGRKRYVGHHQALDKPGVWVCLTEASLEP